MPNAARHTASFVPAARFASEDASGGGHGNRDLVSRAAELFEFVLRLGAESFHEARAQGLRVGLAEADWQRALAHALVERQYRRSGFVAGDATLPRVAENECVVVAMEGLQTLGTVTLRRDRGEGLLADAHYRREIDNRRTAGVEVCEFSRFAIDSTLNVLDIVDPMLHVVCNTGLNPERPTEVFVECHPRHAAFYRRVLGFAIAGRETVCERVGAPAVLLQAQLAELQYAPALARRRQQRGIATQNDSDYLVPCPAIA